MAYAETTDILDRWTGAEVPSDSRIAAFIADAEVVIRHEFPDLDDRIDSEEDGTVSSETVRFVVTSMVLRHLYNPQGLRSEGGIGPFGGPTWAGNDLGKLSLTDSERSMLSGQTADVGGAFAIDTVPTYTGVHADICSLNFGATYCSCGAILTMNLPLYERYP